MSAIGVIAAMAEEVEHVLAALENPQCTEYAGIAFYSGTLRRPETPACTVVLARSGIGKVNAALTTQLMIDRYGVELIINTGSAGGLGENQQLGDFVLADRVCHHDVDVTLLGLQPGELPGLPRYFPVRPDYLQRLDNLARQQGIAHHMGTIATGESFIYRPEQVAFITQNFENVVACEMEAAAVAQVAWLNGRDVLIIRALSDIAGSAAEVNFEKYLQLACLRSSQLVLAFVAEVAADPAAFSTRPVLKVE
jgi:adenosylhomocysteine nucleosidase